MIAIETVDETGSTNADLLARVPALSKPLLLRALRQNAGRGRAGRSWLSDPDSSLTFSLAWKFAGPTQRLLGLPLAVGVALAEALASLDVGAQLKWPNDVLKDGDKLAGILIETQAANDGGVWAVIGIGMNLLMPAELEARIGRSAAAAPWLARMDRDALMARLLGFLEDAMREFDAAGFAPFRARWNALHAWRGHKVVIKDGDAIVQRGCALGVDDFGRLVLDNGAEIVAGDVSLRLED
ncbi:MAG: biotin--[acetyl-CoA-carboxylase] ligase [Massilia sp.]|nr:biotin--[acetyl-CoA-carboxylase] ligase [Massilia sp.]